MRAKLTCIIIKMPVILVDSEKIRESMILIGPRAKNKFEASNSQ